MAKIDHDLFEVPACRASTMCPVMPQIGDRQTRNHGPLLVRGWGLETLPQVHDPAGGEVIGLPLLAQPSRALAGKDVGTLRLLGSASCCDAQGAALLAATVTTGGPPPGPPAGLPPAPVRRGAGARSPHTG